MAKGDLTYKDYERSLGQILSDLPPVIVIEGGEDYLRSAALAAVMAKLKEVNPGISEVMFYGPASQGEAAFNLNDLMQELNSSSLFSSSKIVVFRRAQRMLFLGAGGEASSKKGGPLEALADYITNPAEGNFLIIEVDKVNKGRKIGKDMAKAPTVFCPVLSKRGDVAVWLRAEAQKHGKKLDPDAPDMLFTAHGGNLGALAGEIEKISLYGGASKTITLEDVQTFMTGSVEFSVFELTNAIEERDLGKALHCARLITGQGSRDQKSGKRQDGDSSAHQALAMISSRLEILLRARAIISAGGRIPELCSELGVGNWQAESLFAAAKRFTLLDLKNAINSLTTEMHSSHDTGADVQLSLERLVAGICKP